MPAADAKPTHEWPVTIEAAGHARQDAVAAIPLKADDLPAGAAPVAVREVAADGEVLDAQVPLQVSADGAELLVLLKGATPADGQRRFIVTLGTGGAAAGKPLVGCEPVTDYQGQDAWRITTPGAAYVYHIRGAGFASLLDADGRDWISYRPTGGSAGNYRGIPNLSHPEGYFHPGGDKCTSKLVEAGPLRVAIESTAEGGKWAVRWDVYPTVARLTVRKAAKAYWFLYEGTPGGKIDLKTDYCIRLPDTRTSAGEKWDQKLPTPAAVAFGDAEQKRALLLINHDAPRKMDSYWPMQGNMTVFGFGRQGLNKSMTKAPAHFTIGLCPADALTARAAEALNPLRVAPGPVRSLGGR